MEPGLKIVVIECDEDYLGIEVCAASTRYAGTARIYAGLDELTDLAILLEGFPKSPTDDRRHEFGSTDPQVAGGFARLHFHCIDGAGHAAVDVTFEDDGDDHMPASAQFAFRIDAVELDEFVRRLHEVGTKRCGEAMLRASI